MKGAGHFAESVLKNPGDFLDNLDEYAKGIIKDPLNLIGLAIGGPIFASNITWGAFEVGVGLGGIYAGPNWFKALGQGWGALSGGGLGFGAPTLNVASPVFNWSRELWSQPSQHVYVGGQQEAQPGAPSTDGVASDTKYTDYNVTQVAIAGGQQVPTSLAELNKAMDGAMMSDRAYNPTNFAPIGGWSHTRWGVFYQNADKSGGQAVLFFNRTTRQYALAFAGTQPADFKEDVIKADLGQTVGKVSAQYDWAVNLTGRLKKNYGNNLILVGHSLGGGLATASAAAHKLNALTFNPASLHPNNIARYGDVPTIRRFVKAYQVQGEIIGFAQGVTGSSNYHYGVTFALPAKPGVGAVGLHQMPSVIWGIQDLQRTISTGGNPADRVGIDPNSQNYMLNNLLYERGQ